MKKEKIYIAGKVTGDPCYKMKFNAGVERLVELGWKREEIVNPAQLIDEGTPWLKAMWKCLRLMRKCGWVALRIERLVARVTMKWMIYIHPKDNKREQPKK